MFRILLVLLLVNCLLAKKENQTIILKHLRSLQNDLLILPVTLVAGKLSFVLEVAVGSPAQTQYLELYTTS
jgi:hypothetical protein